jgi:hypothetical protein
LRQDDNTGIGVNEGDLKKAVLPSVGSDRRLKDNIACSDKLGLEFVVGQLEAHLVKSGTK